LDAKLFDAYNHCDLEKFGLLLAERPIKKRPHREDEHLGGCQEIMAVRWEKTRKDGQEWAG
jgi:hypothetical protein